MGFARHLLLFYIFIWCSPASHQAFKLMYFSIHVFDGKHLTLWLSFGSDYLAVSSIDINLLEIMVFPDLFWFFSDFFELLCSFSFFWSFFELFPIFKALINFFRSVFKFSELSKAYLSFFNFQSFYKSFWAFLLFSNFFSSFLNFYIFFKLFQELF